MADDVEFNVDGLEQIIKALKAKPPTIKVGVLGSNNSRTEKSASNGKTNSDIGIIHEFGAPEAHIPQRSFLRMPLMEFLPKRISAAELVTEKSLIQVIRDGSLVSWIEKVAVVALGTVLEAFETGGYGKWAPWKGTYKSRTGNILVDTTSLRDSITTEIIN